MSDRHYLQIYASHGIGELFPDHKTSTTQFKSKLFYYSALVFPTSRLWLMTKEAIHPYVVLDLHFT